MGKGRNSIIVGLTGGIGSGKSAVSGFLEQLGAAIIDSDLLAREVVAPGSEALEEITAQFGKEVLLSDGSLDRKKLGALIFSSAEARAALERITHPRIRSLFLRRLKEASEKHPPLIVGVIPLLFETENRYPEFQKIIVVSAERDRSIDRIMQRDGCSRELAEKKIEAQLPIATKEAGADYVLKNNGSLAELQETTARLYREIVSSSPADLNTSRFTNATRTGKLTQ